MTARTTRSRRTEVSDLLADHVSRKSRKKRHDGGGLNHSAAQGIRDFHVSGNDGTNQAGYAEKRVAAQLERIAKAVVHAAKDHIDLVQTIDGLEIDAPVAHREVRAFNESESQVSRQIGVLEVGLVVRAGCQQDDARIAALSEGGKRVALCAEERRQAYHVRTAKNIGQTSEMMVRFSSA